MGVNQPMVGLGVREGMLGPPLPLIPKQACLYGSGVPCDSPLKGHSLRDVALITPGKARSSVFYFIFGCQSAKQSQTDLLLARIDL